MRISDSDESVSVNRIKTGWSVDHSYETEFTNRGGKKETEYHNDTYAYGTADEAMAKVKEVVDKMGTE